MFIEAERIDERLLYLDFMACNFLRRVSPSEIFSIALITWKQPAIGLAVALGALFLETNNPAVVGRLFNYDQTRDEPSVFLPNVISP